MLDTKECQKGKIDDAADKIKGWTQEAGCVVEAVKGQVQAVAAGASGLAGMAKDTAQEWASSVGGAAVQAKDKARHVASAATEMVGEVGEDLTALIRRHPLQALLAGVGVGFAMGFLTAHVLRRS